MANSTQFENSEVTHDNTDVTNSYSPIPQLKRNIDDTNNSENIFQLAVDTKILLTGDDDSLFYPIRSKFWGKWFVEKPTNDLLRKDKIPNSKLASVVQYATNILQGRII